MGKTADVVIIGGGLIGCSAAYYLSKKGMKTVLLERNFLASEASGANGGMVGGVLKRPPDVELEMVRRGLEMYETLGRELDCEIDYVKSGGLYVVETEEQWEPAERYARDRMTKGYELQLLNGRESRELEPLLSESIAGAIFDPSRDQANPFYVCNGYARAAARLGAEIHTHTPVRSVEKQGSRVTGVGTDEWVIEAPVVINSAGSWAAELGRMAGIEVPIKPTRGQVMVSEPMPPVWKHTIFYIEGLYPRFNAQIMEYQRVPDTGAEPASSTVGLQYYGRQGPDGKLYLGSGYEVEGTDKRCGAQDLRQSALDFRRVFPALEGLNIIRAWAGLIPYTPDGLPIVGKVPGLEGFIMAAGHGGYGFSAAPMTGKLVAELVCGEEPSLNPDELSINRLQHC